MNDSFNKYTKKPVDPTEVAKADAMLAEAFSAVTGEEKKKLEDYEFDAGDPEPFFKPSEAFKNRG